MEPERVDSARLPRLPAVMKDLQGALTDVELALLYEVVGEERETTSSAPPQGVGHGSISPRGPDRHDVAQA